MEHKFTLTSVTISILSLLLRHPAALTKAFNPAPEPVAVSQSAPVKAEAPIPEYKVTKEFMNEVFSTGVYKLPVKNLDKIPLGYLFSIYTDDGHSLLMRVRDRLCDSEGCYVLVSLEVQK